MVTSFIDITERVARERELQRLYSRESAVLDGANVSIIGTDLDGTIHTFNAAAEHMLGWKSHEVVGKQTPSILHDPGEVAARASELGIEPGFSVFVHAAWTGKPETREWSYVRKDGTSFPVALTVTGIRDPRGRLVGFMGIAEDISERKRVTAELEKLALVASRTHNIVIITDAAARAEWVNEAFTRLTGYTFEEVRGMKIGPLVQTEKTDRGTLAQMRQAIVAGEGFQVEVLNRGKDGHEYWLDIDCRPIVRPDGIVSGFVAVETDITARKSMEAELRRNESRFRAFVEGLPDTVIRVSRDGIVRDVHSSDATNSATPRQDSIGRELIEVFPPELGHKFQSIIVEVTTTGAGVSHEYQLTRGAVTLDFEARFVPGANEDVILVVRDVSERKLLERLKDEFVSTVSHELRTPLTAIQGTLGLLAGGILGQLTDEAARLVDVSLKNAERLSRLTNDILDIEQMMRNGTRLYCRHTDLVALVSRAVQEVTPVAQEFGVRFVVNAECDSAVANVDSDRFLQIMFNLLSNAAKYGNPDADVLVRLGPREKNWVISVISCGHKIPDEFRSRMFSRFSRVDGSNQQTRSGSGLGLAITKMLVDLMGGHIDYASTDEQTEFFVTLPQSEPT